MSDDQWKAAYREAFCRIAVEQGYWTAQDALPWAESCEDDACAAARDCDPASVAEVDVEVCLKESQP